VLKGLFSLSTSDVLCRCKSVAVSRGFQSWIPAISENVFPFNSLPASGIRLLYEAVVSFLSNTGDVNSEYSHKVSSSSANSFLLSF